MEKTNNYDCEIPSIKDIATFISTKCDTPLGDLCKDILSDGDFPFDSFEDAWKYISKKVEQHGDHLKQPSRDFRKIYQILSDNGIGHFSAADLEELRKSNFESDDDFFTGEPKILSFNDLMDIHPPHIIETKCKWSYGWPGCPKGYEQFNEDWQLSERGDMCFHNSRYYIDADRLKESDWIIHLMGKVWFDANTFLPAYFEACRRAGIKKVTITTIY